MELLNENNHPTKCVLVRESENIVHYDEIRMCPSPRSFEENLNPLVHLFTVQRLYPLPHHHYRLHLTHRKFLVQAYHLCSYIASYNQP